MEVISILFTFRRFNSNSGVIYALPAIDNDDVGERYQGGPGFPANRVLPGYRRTKINVDFPSHLHPTFTTQRSTSTTTLVATTTLVFATTFVFAATTILAPPLY
jgi:hypothetical protein